MQFIIPSLILILEVVTNGNALLPNYDYVAIGAGSAGSIVATRLSEDPLTSVLLLEAGGEPPSISKSPGLFFLQFFSKYDWKYFTTIQAHTNLGEYWARGKLLGGSGSMNLAIFLRPNEKDFEKWENQGCPNWSWEESLPYYNKIENYLSEDSNGIHGIGGPIYVTTGDMNDEMVNLFVETWQKHGLKYRDPSDGGQTGVHPMPVNIHKRIRQSSYTNYLRPAINKRSNLKVETFALAERILFDENNRATAVLYSKNGVQRKAYVAKEVIVCGGTINTPQLLMLSGIGPREHLESFGIKVIVDLPVGKNLVDEFVVFNIHHPNVLSVSSQDYLEMGNALYNSKYNNKTDYPDIQMIMFRAWFLTITFVVSLRPETRGQITLRSIDPRVHPEIDFQYMSVERDLERHADGLRKAHEVLKDMLLIETISPECLLLAPLMNDAYWKCRVTSLGASVYHPVGTCKMGSTGDDSVVDCNLKVHGIQNVRVVDASVFPAPLSANPQATIFMVAEKASDSIINTNK